MYIYVHGVGRFLRPDKRDSVGRKAFNNAPKSLRGIQQHGPIPTLTHTAVRRHLYAGRHSSYFNLIDFFFSLKYVISTLNVGYHFTGAAVAVDNVGHNYVH